MPSSVEKEIIGDWNNLKGTEYHLIYALWLLVYRKVHSLTFYSGNDLLAHPTAPPILQDAQSIVSLHVEQPEEDEWIQLKATEETWTLSGLLRDNLLANFLYNALSSEHRERAWRVQLITQAAIQKKEVADFLDNPAGKPRLSRRLNAIVSVVQKRWQSEGQGDVDTAHLSEITFTILRQIAEMRPIRLETLKAQIETQLAYTCPDPEAVKLIADALLGAILRDAAPGPEDAPVYTAQWVEHVAQKPLMSHTLLTSDPVHACAEVVKTALPSTWDVNYFVSRSSLENAWRQFLVARETLFVLIGGSGVGKSWAVADWVTRVLDGHVRLLIRGSELYNYRELSTLIVAKLRRFAPADWSDEQCFRRLQAASIVKDQGLFVLCIDDLHFPLGTEEVSLFVRYLGRLVEQCRERGVKLVLTCQKHIWDAHSHSLKKEIAPHDLFSLEPEIRPTPELECAQLPVLYSFFLSDLTPDELTDVLKQRLPAGIAERIAIQLRAPAFAALRNPYLLNLFLYQYGAHLSEPDVAPTPVSVDALLDKRVQDAFLDVAGSLGYDVNDVELAFHALQRLLWAVRPGGLTSIQTVGCLNTHVFELGNTAMRELRRAGLLTTESPVRLAEPAVAARFFARDLKERLQGGEDVSGELHPEIDSDVVGALLRAVSDPVVLAEKLLERDPRWLVAVANGLAQVIQGTPEDYEVLAFLSALAGSQARGDAGSAIYDALGQLASRGKRAWQWVIGMYLSDRIRERFRGGWALATTMELVPERVEMVMQQRLESAAKIDDSKREKRECFLQDALSPVSKMNNRIAAEVGQRIIHQYGHLAGAGESRLSRDFLRDIDEIRGRIALWTSSGELDRLLIELCDKNPQIRYRTACALRPIAVERPEGIQEALCGAIRREEDAGVMNRLLWTAYRLEEVAPAELLDAVEASFAVKWQERYTTTGLALAVLGDIANRSPARVARLLPRSLESYESWTRAFLSEMYVYAWWRCAEYLPDARLHLRVLTEADLTEFPGGYRIFALRGAVIARLGMMCLDVVLSSDELVGQQTPYPAGTLLFCYLNVSEFVKRHASALRGHAQCGQLRDLLLACLQEEENVTIHPLEEELRGSRYLCARSCREMLLHLDEGGAHILQRERQESVAYSVLRHLGSGYDACFTRLIEASSHDVLPLLDTTLSLADDALIAILYYWMEETHAWYSLLIARVYARMFSLGPIGVAEARELCEQMLMALSALPNSPDRRQHEVVYRAITLRLDGDTQPVPELPVSVSTLQHTHALAISLLQRARKENESTWIMEALSDRRGWRDTTRYQLDDQAYSMGTHKYFLYVFPAVRLALIAVGRRYGLDDPAAQFMMERVQVNRLMEEHWRVFHEDIPTDSSQLQKALAAFKEQMELTPRDERLWQARGHLLLRLGRLEEAKESLLHSLSMSSCSQGTRADAHYNLACAYARMKREDDCRRTLQEWIQLRPLNQFYRDWLVRDPDLEEVRGRAWFQAFQGQE